MPSANFNDTGGIGLSWSQWLELLQQRINRCSMPQFPDTVTRPIWESMARWIEQNLFTGTATPRQQYDYWKYPPNPERIGMYGHGSAPAADHIINAWEKLGGGHQVKQEISRHPQNADVYAAAGPGFLESMYASGPLYSEATISVQTQATMTPYDPSAGGTRPIMHYLVNGWEGERAHMRPRWPEGVGPLMAPSRPYLPYLSSISRYLVNGI